MHLYTAETRDCPGGGRLNLYFDHFWQQIEGTEIHPDAKILAPQLTV